LSGYVTASGGRSPTEREQDDPARFVGQLQGPIREALYGHLIAQVVEGFEGCRLRRLRVGKIEPGQVRLNVIALPDVKEEPRHASPAA